MMRSRLRRFAPRTSAMTSARCYITTSTDCRAATEATLSGPSNRGTIPRAGRGGAGPFDDNGPETDAVAQEARGRAPESAAAPARYRVGPERFRWEVVCLCRSLRLWSALTHQEKIPSSGIAREDSEMNARSTLPHPEAFSETRVMARERPSPCPRSGLQDGLIFSCVGRVTSASERHGQRIPYLRDITPVAGRPAVLRAPGGLLSFRDWLRM
jgi:hypothetical protein